MQWIVLEGHERGLGASSILGTQFEKSTGKLMGMEFPESGAYWLTSPRPQCALEAFVFEEGIRQETGLVHRKDGPEERGVGFLSCPCLVCPCWLYTVCGHVSPAALCAECRLVTRGGLLWEVAFELLLQ